MSFWIIVVIFCIKSQSVVWNCVEEATSSFFEILGVYSKINKRLSLCSTQLPEHQRMNANGNRYQMIYFPEIIIQWDTVPVTVILYNCCTMHNSTHSLHNRLLKLWWVRLLHRWPCCYVPSPPLSGANCRPIPLSGGPGPPVSKMAPFSPGSTHTPFPLSVTILIWEYIKSSAFQSKIRKLKGLLVTKGGPDSIKKCRLKQYQCYITWGKYR